MMIVSKVPHPYLHYFPINKSSHSVTVGSGWVGPVHRLNDLINPEMDKKI